MEKSSGSGIGFCGMLAILFIGLKLTNYIDWSWWWVLAPLWLPLALIAICGAIYVSVMTVRAVWRSHQARKRRHEQ